MVRRGSGDRKSFMIQSQVMFIEVEMIVVQWNDWIHVRRKGKTDLGENKKRERENKRHTISKWTILKIHNLMSFCIRRISKWTASLPGQHITNILS